MTVKDSDKLDAVEVGKTIYSTWLRNLCDKKYMQDITGTAVCRRRRVNKIDGVTSKPAGFNFRTSD